MNFNKYLQISPLSSNNNINFGNNNNFNNTFPRIELNNSPSPNFDKDDSFKYSNYLIDNFKILFFFFYEKSYFFCLF